MKPPRIDGSLLLALDPMLATSDGDRWLNQAPRAAKSGAFHETWAHGEGWERHSAGFLERQRAHVL